MSVDSLILSFKTMFSSDLAPDMTLALHLGEDSFSIRITNGELDISRDPSENPDATITTDPDTLISVVYGDNNLNDAIESERLILSGDHEAAARFMRSFPLPEPASI